MWKEIGIIARALFEKSDYPLLYLGGKAKTHYINSAPILKKVITIYYTRDIILRV